MSQNLMRKDQEPEQAQQANRHHCRGCGGVLLLEVEHIFTKNVCEPTSAVAFVSVASENKSGFNGG
jgi:hypothetical protein